MKYIIFTLSLVIAIPGHANNSQNYEDLRAQIEQEADAKVTAVTAAFCKEYKPALIKIAITALAAGIFTPLAINSIKNNDTLLACVYSSCAALCAYFTLLQHSELMEDRRVCNNEIANADAIFQNKMAFIHTRHYMNDIAKYLASQMKEIAQNFLSSQNALPNDKNQQ